MRPPAASAFWQVGIRVSIAVTTRHRHFAVDQPKLVQPSVGRPRTHSNDI